MISLTVFILCHNRPQETRQVIASALAQSDPDFRLIVSDNSSSDAVATLVATEFPNVRYVRRTPMLAPLAHFNQCMDEVSDDYFCLFHDDDLMDSGFVGAMKQAAQTCPDAIAIACNARIEAFGKIQPKQSFLTTVDTEYINAASNLAARYFARSQSGIAPFPAYIYNRRLVATTRIPPDGGK